MLFEHKPVEQLTESDLQGLIGLKENEHIEFKVIYSLFGSDTKAIDEEKFELLKDIASMANAGGGYIFIGIRANDKSIAVKFESIEKDLERLKQTILALCVEHIEERLSGFEVKDCMVDGASLLVIRVPNSQKIPHMVKFRNNTHFSKRYQDGKREMSFLEIRNSFNNDLGERRLASIEQHLRKFSNPGLQITDHFIDNELNELPDGRAVANASLAEFVKNHPAPAFYIGIGPRHPKPNQLDLASKEIDKFLQFVSSEDRNYGWNVKNVSRELNKKSTVIQIGDPNIASMSLMANGYMSFETPLNKSFCWSQSKEEFTARPRFSSFAVVEYPVSFLRMYRRLIDAFSVIDNEWCVVSCYHKVTGYFLAPDHPMSAFFDVGSAKMYGSADDLTVTETIHGEFVPDLVAYRLLSSVYQRFGFNDKRIPFFVDDKTVFEFR